MREGLGKVAEESPCRRVVLLGQEAHVVAEREEPFEDFARLGTAALKRKIVGEPEGARQEGALPGRQAVDVRRRRISQHETVRHELLPDRLDGAEHPRVTGGQETDERDHQETRIEIVGAIVLDEGVEPGIEAMPADVGMDAVADLAPALDGAVMSEPLDGLDPAVERDPRHDLRMREVPARASDLPDAFVRSIPGRFDETNERALHAPGCHDVRGMKKRAA